MFLIPKHDIQDTNCPADMKPRNIFSKNEKYFVEDIYEGDKKTYYIVTDNLRFRNWISREGDFIKQFLIG